MKWHSVCGKAGKVDLVVKVYIKGYTANLAKIIL